MFSPILSHHRCHCATEHINVAWNECDDLFALLSNNCTQQLCGPLPNRIFHSIVHYLREHLSAASQCITLRPCTITTNVYLPNCEFYRIIDFTNICWNVRKTNSMNVLLQKNSIKFNFCKLAISMKWLLEMKSGYWCAPKRFKTRHPFNRLE